MRENVVAIIQARMGSTRLPGKVLADLGDGFSLLTHIVERAQAIRGVDQVVVATTTLSADDAVSLAAHEADAHVYRGHPTDVLDRYRMAARGEEAGIILRITADCPFLDPEVATRVLAEFRIHRLGGRAHFVSNVTKRRTYPDGLDIEVFSADLLEATWLAATYLDHREHVTLGMAHLIPPRGVYQREERGHWRWTIDVPSDLVWARKVQTALPPGAFSQADTIAAIRASGAGFRVTGDEKAWDEKA